MDYRVYVLSKKEKLRLFVFALLGSIVVSILFYNNIFMIVSAPIIWSFGKKPYKSHLSRERKKRLMEMFKDMIYSMEVSFATGKPLNEGLIEAKINLLNMYEESDYIIVELNNMIRRINVGGEREMDVLEDFANRGDLEDIYNFVLVYKTTMETGGDIVQAMRKATEVIGEKISIEREIRAITYQKKVEGKIITSIPITIIGFLRIISPEYLNIMYESLAGRLIMTVSILGIIVGYILIEKITNVEI